MFDAQLRFVQLSLTSIVLYGIQENFEKLPCDLKTKRVTALPFPRIENLPKRTNK
jgi:hypothetical protein